MDINELKRQIIAANKAYRDGHPIMSDQAFDDLCEELSNAIPQNEYDAFRNSLNEGKGKVKHPFVMGSLDKLKREEPEEVIKFVKSLGKTINISAKVDGISSRASYKNGKLTSLTTRGDGSFGENISDKAKYVNGLPHTLVDSHTKMPINEDYEIRGELVILKNDFIKLNDLMDGKFANARNACAGIMNRKDWTPSEVNFVTFIPYTILDQLHTKADQFKILDSINGMMSAWYVSVDVDSIKDIPQQLFDWASQEFDYETDGLVVCADSYINEDKYRPDKCKAFKINMLVAETTLIDVVWEGPSKDGFFCPVGIIEPTDLGGSCISRVTLHNLDFINQLGLMYGSRVIIKKSGDVIPHIECVVGNMSNHCTNIILPTECQCCGSKLVRDGVNMRCINKDCADQVIHRLVNFIKKLGVKSASNATLKNFGITSFEKLISFTPNTKYKSEVKLYDELYSKVFSRNKADILSAMNFVGLAETLVKKIIDYYGFDAIESSSFNEIAYKSLPMGIGSITMDKFIDDLPEALRFTQMVVNDTRYHYIEGTQMPSRNIKIIGSICVTGSLNFGSRNKFLEFAKDHGYESKSGVTKGLTYLINNDINSNSSKNRKAKELGIKILTEAEFMKLIENDTIETSLFDM